MIFRPKYGIYRCHTVNCVAVAVRCRAYSDTVNRMALANYHQVVEMVANFGIKDMGSQAAAEFHRTVPTELNHRGNPTLFIGISQGNT